MNFYCNSEGKIYHIDPERVYQGSAGVNTIRLIGQFSPHAQVMVKYKLPNGIIRSPKLMNPVFNAQEIISPNVGEYSVWETLFGAVFKLDDNGNIVKNEEGQPVYEYDYSLTEYAGQVTVQFEVYSPESAAKLATESTYFTIEKGVPSLEDDDLPPNDAGQLKAAILNALAEALQILDVNGKPISGLFLRHHEDTQTLEILGKVGVTRDEVRDIVSAMIGSGGGGGSGGADGVSPTIDVAEIENGHRVTITDVNGQKSFDVLNGKDYVLTEADKNEIVNEIEQGLLGDINTALEAIIARQAEVIGGVG